MNYVQGIDSMFSLYFVLSNMGELLVVCSITHEIIVLNFGTLVCSL